MNIRFLCALALVALPLCTSAGHAQTEAEALADAKAANERKDYVASLAIYIALYDKGSAVGATMVGLMHWAGLGVKQDTAAACRYFEVGDQRGSVNSTELLADCYFKGKGMKQDYVRSAALYTKAMDKGLPQSYCALGNQYLDGLGVAKDEAKAAELCRKGAELGVADAQTDLGQMYMSGRGVAKSLVESAKWFEKAADQGQPNAAYFLGRQYWNGDGVPRDRARAGRLHLIAAHGGHTRAPTALAVYYVSTGVVDGKIAVEKDAVKAVFWATIAAQVEPDPAASKGMAELAAAIVDGEPAIKAKADALIAAGRFPPD